MEMFAVNARKNKSLGARTYNLRHVLLICAIFCVLIIVRALSDIGFYLFAGISLVVFTLSNIDDCIVFLFFLLPFNTILKPNPGSRSLFSILFFLVILKMVIRHQKIPVKLLMALAAFFAYCLLFSGFEEIPTIITMIAGVLMLFYMRNEDFKLDSNFIVLAYSFGICIASLLALCKGFFPIINLFINDTIMVFDKSEYTTRFSGLQGNPNYYTLDITVVLSAIIVLMYNKKKTPKIHIVCFVALTFLGIMSVSKSFLLTWIFLMVCWFMLSLKRGYKKFVSYIFVVAIGIIIAYYFAYDYINAFMFRFTEDGSGTIDSVTTGRSTIWVVYLKTILNEPKILFFGNGLNSMIQPLGKVPHNTYLDLLFNLGILGAILLIALLRMGMGKIRLKGGIWLLVIMLMIRMFAISILSYDNLWLYLMLIQMLMHDHQKDNLKN